jgi:hypothetical protein
MGLLDGIREILGVRAEADATRDADPEDLFGMSTAYLTMGADLGYEVARESALCFSGVDSTDFRDAVEDVVAILERSREEFGTRAALHEDDHGYQWVVLEDDDFEDLVANVHFAADTFIERGYGDRLLAAVFGFAKDDQDAYWIYSFRRGAFYPFAPADPDSRKRDKSTEFKLESILDGELEVEDDKEYWYPLWPGRAGRHPWES